MPELADYQLFGLRIRSDIPLPELFPAAGYSVPDVRIRRAVLPSAESEAGLNGQGEALLLTVPDVGSYRIERGVEILVDADGDVPERNVRLFLLGSAFGALLHQRGLLPLHANAIGLSDRAIAFMGESGAGKSTLAAWFHDRGHRIIADDVCVVRFESDGRPLVSPGLPRLRLWADTLKASGRDPSSYERAYADAAYDKFEVPTSTNGVEEAAGLGILYVLDRAEQFSISRLAGLSAAEAVFAHTYRGSYLAATKGAEAHFHSCVRLVQRTPVYRVTRRWGLEALNEQCSQILAHAEEHSISEESR